MGEKIVSADAPLSEKGKDEQVDLSSLEEILTKYADPRRSLIPILQETQDVYGYLPRKVLEAISRSTDIPLSKVYGVVTFYAQFYLEPQGRNRIKVCQGTACHVRGGRNVLKTLEKELGLKEGETSPDLKFSLETVRCLGTCFLAPVMVINNSYYGRLSESRVRTILGQSS